MSVDTDEQIDVDVDLDLTIPCASTDCDSEATWHGEALCPHGHRLEVQVCEMHYIGVRAMEDLKAGWICVAHRSPLSTRFSWRRL